jgi:hypothetical protein
LFPLEKRIEFERNTHAWIEPLSSDALYLHCMVFSTQVYFDLMTGNQTSTTGEGASENFMKTLRFLRERLILGKDQSKLSDSTVRVVLALVFRAHVRGEQEALRNHLDGLKNLVNLRGGIQSFKVNVKLLIEVHR